jgi:hypothetical protein
MKLLSGSGTSVKQDYQKDVKCINKSFLKKRKEKERQCE